MVGRVGGGILSKTARAPCLKVREEVPETAERRASFGRKASRVPPCQTAAATVEVVAQGARKGVRVLLGAPSRRALPVRLETRVARVQRARGGPWRRSRAARQKYLTVVLASSTCTHGWGRGRRR